MGVINVDEDNDPRIAPTQRISQVNLSLIIFFDVAMLRCNRSVGCLMTEPDTCGGEYHPLAICSQRQNGIESGILLSYLKRLLALEKELHIVTGYQS